MIICDYQKKSASLLSSPHKKQGTNQSCNTKQNNFMHKCDVWTLNYSHWHHFHLHHLHLVGDFYVFINGGSRWQRQLSHRWDGSLMLQQGQTLTLLLLQGVDEEIQRFAGEQCRGEEVAFRDEEMRKDACAGRGLQTFEEIQETGRKILASPHGVFVPEGEGDSFKATENRKSD